MNDKIRVRELFARLRPGYSVKEAKREIDDILRKYGDNCEAVFERTYVDIIDSYKVHSRDDRHLICEIIARTGLTERDYENLSAEWEVHNVAWYAHVGRSSAKDASLDYNGDIRFAVRAATAIFDALDIE